MFKKLSLGLAGLTGALVLASAAPALADPIFFTGSAGAVPSGTLVNPDALPSGVSISFSPDAAEVTGSTTNLYAAPYLSSAEATWLGQGQTTAGPDTGSYLTSGAETGSHPNAAVTISFAATQFTLGLIWGSIDSFNTITFYDGGTAVASITGCQVDATGCNNQSGNRDAADTYGVNFFLPDGFTSVEFTSSQYAEEFTGITYTDGSHNPPPGLPEPGSLALFGAGLGLLGMVRFATRRGKSGTQPLLSA